MSDATNTAPPGLLLSDDLIFTSRIAGTARALGLEVRQVRALDQLPEMAARLGTRCVIVDLSFPGLDLPEMMRRLGEPGKRPRVVAYGSHVDAESLRAARAAGCTPVLPRSKFVEDLPAELAGWLAR
jgi:CheY-like chemotaxis protein